MDMEENATPSPISGPSSICFKPYEGKLKIRSKTNCLLLGLTKHWMSDGVCCRRGNIDKIVKSPVTKPTHRTPKNDLGVKVTAL